MLLVIYGLLMLVLTIYAAHAYLMLYLYRKNRDQRVKPLFTSDDWPHVTVQLPVYNERYVVQRLIEAACALDYPKDRLEIQVLDDSNDETQLLVRNLVADQKARGINISHLHRLNRTGFKAGALRAGLETAQGEYLVIFDADFIPPVNFLKAMIPYFSCAEVGLVQSRWGHLNGNYSMLTRGQTIGLDAHFVLEHGARNASGIFINFNGTAGIWRKAAILGAGNWQDDTLTEDIDISYRAQLAGWKFVYVNDVVCPAEVPAEVYGLKTQQYRWAKGAIQTAKKLLPIIWRNRSLPLLVKFEATVHLTNHLVFPVLLCMALLYLPLLSIWIKHHEAWLVCLVFTLCILNAFSYPLFYIFAQREIYPDWKRRVLFLPILLAGAMGLSVINSRAVLSALIGRKSAFNRTPKFDLGATKTSSWKGKQYRSRFNGTVLVEFLLIVYLTLTLVFAVYNLQYMAIPFILIYWFGFLFIGTLSLVHAIQS